MNQTYVGKGVYRESIDLPGRNWRDNPDAVARLKKGVVQYEVTTLIMARDWSFSGPYDSYEEAAANAPNSGSLSSQILSIPEDSK